MELKPEDMLKLEKAFFKNLERDNCEYGAIGVDCKRPFGNSDVEGDILDIIGDEPEGDDGDSECWNREQRDYAAEMYDNLISWLQEKHLTATEGMGMGMGMEVTQKYSDKHFKDIEKKLTPLGFRILGANGKIEIFHDDLPAGIDMSASDPDKIIYIVYQLGKASGREEKVKEIRNVLGIRV